MSDQEHTYSILEGLPRDYNSVVTVIESRFEPLNIEEIEALLLTHESRIERYNIDIPMMYYTLFSTVSPYSVPNKGNDTSGFLSRGRSGSGGGYGSHHGRGGGDHGRGNGEYGRGGGHGRSGRGHFANFQCQLCYKFGHTASHYFNRYDNKFQPNSALALQDPGLDQYHTYQHHYYQHLAPNSQYTNPPSAMVISNNTSASGNTS